MAPFQAFSFLTHSPWGLGWAKPRERPVLFLGAGGIEASDCSDAPRLQRAGSFSAFTLSLCASGAGQGQPPSLYFRGGSWSLEEVALSQGTLGVTWQLGPGATPLTFSKLLAADAAAAQKYPGSRP